MAQLYFKISKNLSGAYQVSVNLDSEESVNAISGSINIAPGAKVEDLRISNSIINFWLEEPKISDNKITFSGIRPGGFTGKNGEIFSITMLSEPKFNFLSWNKEETKVLLNDGTGAESVLNLKNLEAINLASLEVTNEFEVVDTVPPESFTPLISKSGDLYNGKSFIAFSTTDKQSDIEYYELAEKQSWFPLKGVRLDWEKVSSPSELKDQNLSSYVYIRAVDTAGNERIEVIHPINPTFPFHPYFLWSIIIIIAVGLAALVLRLTLKK